MKKTCLGFTLIELLVVISIIGILFVIGIAQYMNFNRRQILDQAAQELKNNLRFAQGKALAGEKPASWCVDPKHLRGYRLKFNSSGSYIIEASCSDGNFQLIKSVNLPSSITGPSGTSVLFKVLAQGIEGLTTSFTLSYSGVGSKAVVVTKEGKIE